MVVIGEPVKLRPVVPPDAATDVTVPVTAESASSLTTPLAFLKYSFSSARLIASSPAARLPAKGTKVGVTAR